MRVLLATYPFGQYDPTPLKMLAATGWEIVENPFRRRLKLGDIEKLLPEVDAVIAGTEPYPHELVTRCANRLKVIARVGVGLDNVSVECALKDGVVVTYTPDAPSQSVAELTVSQMINLCRFILPSDHSVREGAWNRMMGWLLSERTIGIIGLGRIGKIVFKLLDPFKCNIYVCDTNPDIEFVRNNKVQIVDAETLFKCCNLLTVHIPHNKINHHFINRQRISLMQTGSFIINTSRGAVLDEVALTDALLQRHLGGVALDVFENEPYEGNLTQFENVILTAHIGASSRESRRLMELQATEDCIRVLRGEHPLRPAPKED